MKKPLYFLIAVLLLFSACVPAADPAADPTADPAETASPDITADPAPFKAGKKYVFTLTDERGRKWEEDVVAFASKCLQLAHGHPLLTDRITTVYTHNEPTLKFSNSASVNFCDAELREEFIGRINAIITSIPESTDDEIVFAMMEAAALLRDAHTFVSADVKEAFPLWVTTVYSDGRPECVVEYAPEKESGLLGSRLVAINGIPLSEITERMRPFIAYEAETWFIRRAYGFNMLMNCAVLRHIGVMGGENTAEFTLLSPSGEELTRSLSSRAADSLWYDAKEYLSGTGSERGSTSRWIMELHPDVDIWYEFLNEGEALYIRVVSCDVDEELEDVVSDAFLDAKALGRLKYVIVDFRDNYGGYANLNGSFVPLADAMRDSGAELYVLINEGSFSAAVGVPALLRRRLESVKLVGSPAGQPTEFFAGAVSLETPNSSVFCQISTCRASFWPGCHDDALMPDVTVYQSYEDFLNGVDSVLRYILEGGE